MSNMVGEAPSMTAAREQLRLLFFPFGTILGIFTILALARTEVKARFEAASTTVVPPPLPPGPTVT